MGFDHWKSTDPTDREYCRCGLHGSICQMDEHGKCHNEEEEEEHDPQTWRAPTKQ